MHGLGIAVFLLTCGVNLPTAVGEDVVWLGEHLVLRADDFHETIIIGVE